MFFDELSVNVAALDNQIQQTIQNSDIGTEHGREMHISVFGGYGFSGINHDEFGWLGSESSILNS